jgi:hypothetical protein
VKGLGLSLHDIPVNVCGFRNVQSIALTGAPAFMQDGWISGLDRLPNLRAVYLNMNHPNIRLESASPPAQPLTIPEGVVELTVSTELSSLAWLSLPSTLKTLSVWSRDLDLETLGGMRGLRPENLESLEVHTNSPRDGESRPPVDLSGLARFNAIRVLKLHMPNIASLDGVGAMPRLRKLQVASSVLKDIEAVRTLIHLEYFSLIYRGIDRHDGDSNTEFGVANRIDAPRVVGPISIAPLTALPKLVWVNTDLFTVADVDRLADFSPRTDLRLRNILREAPQVPG